MQKLVVLHRRLWNLLPEGRLHPFNGIQCNTIIYLVSVHIKKKYNNDVETDLILSKTVPFEGLIKPLKWELFKSA